MSLLLNKSVFDVGGAGFLYTIHAWDFGEHLDVYVTRKGDCCPARIRLVSNPDNRSELLRLVDEKCASGFLTSPEHMECHIACIGSPNSFSPTVIVDVDEDGNRKVRHWRPSRGT